MDKKTGKTLAIVAQVFVIDKENGFS